MKVIFFLLVLFIIWALANGVFPHPISIFAFGILCFAMGYMYGKELGIKEGIKRQKDFEQGRF